MDIMLFRLFGNKKTISWHSEDILSLLWHEALTTMNVSKNEYYKMQTWLDAYNREFKENIVMVPRQEAPDMQAFWDAQALKIEQTLEQMRIQKEEEEKKRKLKQLARLEKELAKLEGETPL